MKRREAKSKGEKKRYTHLNAEFHRIPRRNKKAFLSDQCKEIEENNRMGKIRHLFKKIRDQIRDQSLSRVRLFATPWTSGRQASLSITNSQSPPKPMSIESVCHPADYRPLLLLPSIFLSIRVFSNESALCTRWPKYWSFSFNISPSSEHSGLISFSMDWLYLLAVQGTLKSLAIKRNEILIQLGWTLKTCSVKEARHKRLYYMNPFVWNVQNRQIYRDRK